MPTSRTVAFSALTAMLVALALAGCGSSTSPTTVTAPATGSTSATAQTTGTPTPTATTGPALTTLPAACPTAAEVSSTLGITAPPVGQTKTSTTLDCAYVGPSVGNMVSINCTTAKKLTPAAAEAALRAQGTTAKFQKISGIGDAAFYDTQAGGSYIAVLSGGLSFHVVVGSVVAPDKLEALAKSILAG